jgi:3-methyladenine DNA glycosylase AlkD
MDITRIIKTLKHYSSPKNKDGMAKFGIATEHALGVSIPNIRKIAREIGKNHELALSLWKTNIHEARILACIIDDPNKVTSDQMDAWVNDFNSWDLCDQCCMNLFDKTRFAYLKAVAWPDNEKEFVRRAGFALMASLAVHDKQADDGKFIRFFPIIKQYSTDERNFVKKAVNWALRQIGKRNNNLRKEAIKVAEEIQNIDSNAAKWVACDALRELNNVRQ